MTSKKGNHYDERVGHYSLHHSLTPKQVASYLSACVKTDNLDLFTTTECKGKKKKKALQKALGKEWALRLRGEYLIGWKRAKFRQRVVGRLVAVSDVYPDGGKDNWRDQFVHFQPINHRPTKTRGNVSSAHTQSGVQHGGRFKTGSSHTDRQVRGWIEGTINYGKRLGKLQSKRIWVIAGLDANTDQKNPEPWRDLLEENLQTPSALGDKTYKWGTHAGRRLIDTIHTSLEVRKFEKSKVSIKPKAVDHAGVVATLRFY